MAQSTQESSTPQHALIDSINDHYETGPTFQACLNAHGMYETTRFVLRLSTINHKFMEQIENSEFEPGPLPANAIQAYSTYIHETIHWWQHVGSTSGLLFSLSYLAQSHSSLAYLRETIANFGPQKPLKGWTDKVLLEEGEAAQAKLAPANIAVNNALDVEYYKFYAFDPRKHINWMIEENHFESVGHMYFVVYGQLVGLISEAIDPNLLALPKIDDWDKEIDRLCEERIEGYYWGSAVRPPPVGMRAIYEGQARFVQLQFLDGAMDDVLTCEDWRNKNFLSGIYVEAFDTFLKLSESEWPEKIADPIVGLFLLVCDLAINPTRGFPLDIESFEDFILDVDVGVRFTQLCLAVKSRPHLRNAVRNYSREEYIEISDELTQETGHDHPLACCEAVKQWSKSAPGLKKLMEEQQTFEFDRVKLPVRVFVSHFVALYNDKYDHPEFFCWPGIYMSGGAKKKDTREIWLRHLSLFGDRGEQDAVFPRRWPNRSEVAVKKMFEEFYGTMAFYDLTRQWILKDGPFVCNYKWISEKYTQENADKWANNTMQQMYGVTLADFEIVQ